MQSPARFSEEFLRQKQLKKDQYPSQWLNIEDDIVNAHPVNPRIRDAIYNDYIVSKMKETEQQYTSYLGLNIWLGTWNVNGKKVDEDISAWLFAGDAARTDLFVLGLEEMVDLTASTVVSESQSQKRSQVWLEKIHRTLHQHSRSPEDRYYCVASKILVGVFLCVFARESLRPSISNVSTTHLATGLLGMMGNKGAVGVRMNINDSSVCFICVHMAAHREKVSERNSEFHRILNEVAFPLASAPDAEPDLLPIAAHDMIYWMGDLNYRITSDVPDSVVFDYAKNDYKRLLSRDQLLVSQNAGFAFVGFTEPPITFPPTYKYIRGTSLYDDRKEKKVRAPSWCDRVLYCLRDQPSATECSLVTVVDYNHVPSMVTSDHKPVFQRAVVLVKKYDEACVRRLREATEAVLRAGNGGVPHVVLLGTELDFGEIRYRVRAHQIVQIRNDSDFNAYYRFLPKDKENHVISSLFSLSTVFGVILPHQTLSLAIDLFIDRANIRSVQNGVINEMIAFRVDNEQDHYLTLKGQFLATSFTRSLQELVRTTSPARANETVDLARAPVRVVPQELWSMVDYLYRHGMMTPSLWRVPSSPASLAGVRECLDTGKSLEGANVSDVANALVEWLESLGSPVIDESFLIGMETVQNVTCSFIDTLLAMHPRENRNVFIYVMKFLQEMLKYSQWNQLDVDFLVILFSHAFLGLPMDVPMDSEAKNEETAAVWDTVMAIVRFLLSSPEEGSAAEKKDEDNDSESND